MLRRIDAGSLLLLPQKSVVICDTLGEVLYYYQAENADTFKISEDLLREIQSSGEKLFTVGQRDAIGMFYKRAQKPFIIAVAAFDEEGGFRLAELRQTLAFSLLMGMLITLVAGYLFSSQILRPITQMIYEVNNISSQNLSRRLATGKGQDELNQLAKTFNDLLNRLQEAFNSQRRFISNASHELSTPLTSISSQLQVTLQKERNV